MNVFIVSHHEGIVGVADTMKGAETLLEAFVTKSGLTYGQPRIEEFVVDSSTTVPQ